MLRHEFLRDEGILIVMPEGRLTSEDFERLTYVVDSYLSEHGKLHGLMIHAEGFPGWADFAALLSHLRFVKDHHQRIERVAAVSDSAVLTIMPKIASHFVAARVEHFAYGEKEMALLWLAGHK